VAHTADCETARTETREIHIPLIHGNVENIAAWSLDEPVPAGHRIRLSAEL